jgi:hypothetical protein
MSTFINGTAEKGASTTLNVWKKLFQSGEHGYRSGVAIHAYSTNGANLVVCTRPRGATAPTDPPAESDRIYTIYAGDTLNLGTDGDKWNDIYIGTTDGTVQTYNATETVN